MNTTTTTVKCFVMPEDAKLLEEFEKTHDLKVQEKNVLSWATFYKKISSICSNTNKKEEDDLISRQAAIDMFQNLAYDDWNQGVVTTWANAYSKAAEMIRDLPSAQSEPHYCRECKWSMCHIIVGIHGKRETSWLCLNWERETDEEGYCYEWERRTE